MDVSMQMRELAHAVGEDFAMHAPDDTAKLVGRARRGRMVWTTGVGAAVVGSAASLAFGGPALASALSSGPAVAPAASDSSTPSATATVSSPPSAMPSTSPTASAPRPGAGTIDLTGGATVGSGHDDDANGDDSSDDHSDDQSDKQSDDHGEDHGSESESD